MDQLGHLPLRDTRRGIPALLVLDSDVDAATDYADRATHQRRESKRHDACSRKQSDEGGRDPASERHHTDRAGPSRIEP